MTHPSCGGLSFLCLVICCGARAADTPGERAVTFHPRGDETIELEGLVHMPDRDGPLGGVVLCHPDPRHSGSMTVPVVAHLQRAFAKDGYATLRFNSRGVGGSTGEFDAGDGEIDDCLGALDFLRAQPSVDAKRVALIGYSFGAWVGLQACVRDAKVPACACLAFPVPEGEDIGRHEYFARITFPVLFVTGAADTISSLATIRRLIDANDMAEHCRVTSIPDADHFLFDADHMALAAQRLLSFIGERLAKIAGERP